MADDDDDDETVRTTQWLCICVLVHCRVMLANSFMLITRRCL